MSGPQFTQYPYRHVIAAIFCSLTFVNAMCWVVVTSISVPVARAFDQSEATVSLVPMSYTILYFIVNLPANWVLDHKGIKMGIIIGAVLTSIGTGIRCLVSTHFIFVIIGQTLCGIGQPFILNAAAKIAIRWFILKDRPPAMALLAMANVLGAAFGFIVPSLFVSSTDSDQAVRTSFALLMLLQFVLSLIPATTSLIWFKERPPSPASVEPAKSDVQFFPTLKSLLKNRRFLGLMYSYGTVMACFSSNASLLDSLYDCYDYSTSQVSLLGIGLTVVGALGSTIFGVILKSNRNFRRVFAIVASIGIIVAIILPIFIATVGNLFPVLFILECLKGVALIPLIPLTFDYACDILYPAGEALVAGLLIAFGNILGILVILVSQNVLKLGEKGNTKSQNQAASLHTLILIGSVLISGLLLYFLFNSELKRTKIEQQQRRRGQGQESLISNK